MTANTFKLAGVMASLLGVAAVLSFPSAKIGAAASDDPVAIYKAKCLMCHSATAAKFFDPAKPDEELVQAILKGKKGEKPPYMPPFEEKGINAETAQQLVAHMKQLKAGT